MVRVNFHVKCRVMFKVRVVFGLGLWLGFEFILWLGLGLCFALLGQLGLGLLLRLC